uniref:Uncharacterized protein n=1 Tax=Anguilla anguilla TaxID=7936 RepID=A0A0E9X937_ANGAN
MSCFCGEVHALGYTSFLDTKHMMIYSNENTLTMLIIGSVEASVHMYLNHFI